jgi:hypothetical protein
MIRSHNKTKTTANWNEVLSPDGTFIHKISTLQLCLAHRSEHPNEDVSEQREVLLSGRMNYSSITNKDTNQVLSNTTFVGSLPDEGQRDIIPIRWAGMIEVGA